MPPQIPVLSKRSLCRFVERFTIELGSCPVKAVLLEISNIWSWLQFDKEVTNSHPSAWLASNMLLTKCRCCSARSFPMVRGTYPLSKFCPRWSCRSSVRLESEAGMGPVNWFAT
ncbi:hypothetical protein BDA96_03G075300 [Sorghum bicolor]|uniref:Uncharacterized protein n=1 Tax=Sorghum bicolor TaxID=4558 RepID=A0A921R9T9_SORBI|nr:hypothetical protein BDA96_03G075300 [Sorghum bicolor]